MSPIGSSSRRATKLTDLTVVSKYALDPVVLCRAAGIHRISELGRGSTRDVSELFALPSQDFHSFLCSNEGEEFLAQLRQDLQRPLCVWLGAGSSEEAERLSRLLGTSRIIDGATYPEGLEYRKRLVSSSGTPTQAENNKKRPWILDPRNLMGAIIDQWEDLSENARQRVRQALLGIDATHLSPEISGALTACGIKQTHRSRLIKWFTNPKVLSYLLVVTYSSLRVLPVSLVKEFHGSLLVLWTMDITTSIPYAWGVLAMFTAKRQWVRIVGTFTTAVTFAAPYVYFAMTGRDYPPYVIVVVILFIISGFLVEGTKYLRERYLLNFLIKAR